MPAKTRNVAKKWKKNVKSGRYRSLIGKAQLLRAFYGGGSCSSRGIQAKSSQSIPIIWNFDIQKVKWKNHCSKTFQPWSVLFFAQSVQALFIAFKNLLSCSKRRLKISEQILAIVGSHKICLLTIYFWKFNNSVICMKFSNIYDSFSNLFMTDITVK